MYISKVHIVQCTIYNVYLIYMHIPYEQYGIPGNHTL